MTQYHESREDKSGKLYELFLFGDVTRGRNELRYAEELRKAAAKIQNKKNPIYLPFNDALQLAENVQEGDPSNPKKLFMRDVRQAVADRLGLSPKDARNLGIFSAVGTPLDVYHSVDAFVVLKTKEGKSKIATLDVTINKEKIAEERTRAHVLIGEVPDPIEQEKEYKAFVAKIADKIVTQLSVESF